MSVTAIAIGVLLAAAVLVLFTLLYAACVVSSRCARLEEEQEQTELGEAILKSGKEKAQS